MEFLKNIIESDIALFVSFFVGLAVMGVSLVSLIGLNIDGLANHVGMKTAFLVLSLLLGVAIIVCSIVFMGCAFCPNCNTLSDATYCTNCGTQIPQETIPTCPECREEWNTPYCGNCGTKIEQTP